jgi:hypothetical protein
MQTHVNSQVGTTSIAWAINGARAYARWLGARIVELIDARADAYAAAALYEKLSKLSNAELERRGIPCGDLPRHVFETLTKR